MRVQSGRWNAEGGRQKSCRSPLVRTHLPHHPSPFPLPHSQFPLPPSRSPLGVTLIELLITISIVATLGAFFLGVSTAAMESSRAARTRTLIGKIHNLLMEHMETYATRRVDIRADIVSDLEANIRMNFPVNEQSRALGAAMADLRLLALREMIKLEMPDRWSDVIGDAVSSVLPNAPASGYVSPLLLPSRPALTKSYLRKYAGLNSLDVEEIQSNQGAECLYMIIMFATADGEARTLFSEQDIGDTDGDGAPEFIDGWGNSIQFVRWPAGFISHSDLMSGDDDLDHDPFDFFRRDQVGTIYPNTSNYPSPAFEMIEAIRNRHQMYDIGAYRILPLIYSRGPDNSTDYVIDTGALVSDLSTFGLDPYSYKYSDDEDKQLATVFDTNEDGVDNSLDNIHNHLLD